MHMNFDKAVVKIVHQIAINLKVRTWICLVFVQGSASGQYIDNYILFGTYSSSSNYSENFNWSLRSIYKCVRMTGLSNGQVYKIDREVVIHQFNYQNNLGL